MNERSDGINDDAAKIERVVEDAFSDFRRAYLGLFSQFTRVVDPLILSYMGVVDFVSQDQPNSNWFVPELIGLSLNDWQDLASSASDLGLVSRPQSGLFPIDARVAGALRTFLRHMSTDETQYMRAFVESAALRAYQHHSMIEQGNPLASRQVVLNEANYLQALSHAAESQLPNCVLNLLLALQHSYDEPARRSEWRALLESVLGLFADTSTLAAIPGRESEWLVIASFLVRLLYTERRLDEACGLQVRIVAALREIATPWINGQRPMDGEGLHEVTRLVKELTRAGQFERQNGRPKESLESYQQAFDLCTWVPRETRQFVARQASDALREMGRIDEAERWLDEGGREGDAGAKVALARAEAKLEEADSLREDDSARADVLAEALRLGTRALELAGQDDKGFLGVIHSVLGSVYRELKRFDSSIEGFRESLFIRKAIGDALNAGRTEANIAGVLEAMGQRREALQALRRGITWLEQAGASGASDLKQVRRYAARLTSEISKRAGSRGKAVNSNASRMRILRSMIASLRRGESRQFFVGLVGYFIDGYPYSASGLSVDPQSTPEIHMTDDGFSCTTYFSPNMLQPTTVKKYRTEFGGDPTDDVLVQLHVRLTDIYSIAEYVDGEQRDLFVDVETFSERDLIFRREMTEWFNRRRSEA